MNAEERRISLKQPSDREIAKTKKINLRLFSKLVCHAGFVGHHIFVNIFGSVLVWTVRSHEIDVVRQLFVFSFGYGTNWNFLFQTTFLFLALSHDALEWVDKHESRIGRLIKYWRDIVYSGLVVPITCFVTGMFWSIYAIDRELVFPAVYDQIVPWWFNHCVHTNIFIIICVETLLQARRRPVDEKIETVCVVTATVGYAVVYYSIYFFGHRWLYQVFGVMTWWQVCIFQCLIWGSSYCFYLVQFPINRLIHGSEEPENDKAEISYENGNTASCSDVSHEGGSKEDLNLQVGDNKTKLVNSTNGVNGNGFKIGCLERNGSLKGDLKKPPFADRSWSLKYRTIRDQFEKTSL